MRVLILEDEPLIALDLEDAVLQCQDAHITFAASLAEARPALDRGVDFALLDIRLRSDRETSLPLARELLAREVPFCFVSTAIDSLPPLYSAVPKVSKPFHQSEIRAIVSASLS